MPDRKRQVVHPQKKTLTAPALRDYYGRVSQFRFTELSVVAGGRAVEVATTLVALIWVERACGQTGLGIFSYVCSLYFIASSLAEWGLPHYVERETALSAESGSDSTAALRGAFQTVLALGILVAVILAASSAFDAAQTRIEEKMGAYILAGLAVPIRNLNRLRMALLNGLGRHEEAARMQGMKHLVFLVVLWIFLGLKVPPSALIGSYLAGELVLAAAIRRRRKLFPLRSVLGGSSAAFRSTLREGSRFVLTDDPIGTILFIDLLVLGYFISAWDLGVYAEASALARLFLLIPAAILPMLRRKYCVLALHEDGLRASILAHGTAARLFALHCLLALYAVYFYPGALHLFFKTGGEEALSFKIFEVLVPGLLLSVSAMALEPLFEAIGNPDSLRKLMSAVLGVNLLLNVTMVPVAGLFGAAVATTASMLLYFLLLCFFLDGQARSSSMGLYLLAGGGAYLACGIVQLFAAGPVMSALLLTITFGGILYVTGFFEAETTSVQLEKGGKDRGRRERVDCSQARGGEGAA